MILEATAPKLTAPKPIIDKSITESPSGRIQSQNKTLPDSFMSRLAPSASEKVGTIYRFVSIHLKLIFSKRCRIKVFP